MTAYLCRKALKDGPNIDTSRNRNTAYTSIGPWGMGVPDNPMRWVAWARSRLKNKLALPLGDFMRWQLWTRIPFAK